MEGVVRECYISPMKTCTKCGEEKPLESFGKESRLPSGRQPHCRECATLYRKRYRQERPEVHRRSNKGHYERNKETVSARHSRWWKANKEWGREYQAQKYLDHRERILRSSKEWRQRNPKMVQAFCADRSARRRGADRGAVSASDMAWILASTCGLCSYCGEARALTVDHIEPISRGGLHEESNIAPSCQSCNSSKKAKVLVVWLAQRRNAA
jgi:5-methylcytosine-specific restriction endonuclease McrA